MSKSGQGTAVTQRFHAIVVGAGLSGLSAALKMHRAGANVCVLEARPRVGGRTCTEVHNGTNVDVGGAYVGPSQNRILRLADEFKIDTYKIFNPPDCKNILMLNGSRSTYTGSIPTLNPFALLDLNSLLIGVERERVKIPNDTPWRARDAKRLDQMNMQQYIDEQAWTSEVKKICSILIEVVLCVEPSEVSALTFLSLVNTSDGILRATETEQGAQERKFKGGSQLISQAMLELLGDRVHLSSPVRSIAQDGNGVTVTSRAGAVFQADYAVVALAPSLYTSIQWQPTLPIGKQMLSQRMPMGTIIKTNMFYERAFWREAQCTGQFVSDEGPVSATFDDTKPDGSHPSIMGFVVANNMRHWAERTSDERKQAICAQYARTFQSDAALRPVAYVEHNWVEEEFSGGCYMGVPGPQVLTMFGPYLRTAHQRVHFAGTETATMWPGYMDGAVQAGERAAHEVLELLHKARAPVKDPGPWIEQEPPNRNVIAKPLAPSWLEQHLPGPSTVVYLLGIILAVGASALFYVSR